MPTNPYDPPLKNVESERRAEKPIVGRLRQIRRYMVLIVLGLLLSVIGYLFFAVVVAIYVGLWLQGEKMYYAQYPWYHLFGGVGATLGMLVAWMGSRLTRRKSSK